MSAGPDPERLADAMSGARADNPSEAGGVVARELGEGSVGGPTDNGSAGMGGRPGILGAVKDLMVVAGPTIAAMSSFTVMQFVDKVMVSRIGPDAIYVGAQGNGGLASWVPISVGYGLLNVVNTYVAQNLGAGKPERGPAYAWTSWWVCAAYWLAVLLPMAALLPTIFEVMREASGLGGEELTEAVRRDEMASVYGRILLAGAVVTFGARCLSQYFYGLHQAWIVMIATVAGNIANIVFNSLFVYGNQTPEWGDSGLDAVLSMAAGVTGLIAEWTGLKPMGVAGAALGTLIGTCIELLIPLAVFVSRRHHAKYGSRSHWRFSAAHARDIIKLGWSQGLMFGNEMLCWAFFMVYLVSQFGSMHSTAGWIAHQWMSMSIMPAVGVSIAVTSAVGKCLGAKRPDLAATRAWTGVGLSVIYMGICGVCFLVFGTELVEMFIQKDTPAEDVEKIVRLGKAFLLACAAFQLFDAIAMVISGALRGAGDTVWPGAVAVVLSWVIIVGGGLAMVKLFPELESIGPWIAASAYIVVLSMAMLVRWLSGRWKTIDLLEKSAG